MFDSILFFVLVPWSKVQDPQFLLAEPDSHPQVQLLFFLSWPGLLSEGAGGRVQ